MSKKGCVLDLRLDDESGTSAHDYSRYGNDGTLTGCKWVENGLEFNGTSDYVNCGNDASLNITDVITISVWARQEIGDAGYMLLQSLNNDTKRLYGMYASGAGVQYSYYDGAKKFVNWPFNTDDNVWHNYIVSVSGLNAILYIDGVSQGVEVLDGAFQTDSSATLSIGCRNPGTGFFNGSISNPLIYNYALSAAEIKRSYNQEVHRYV